MRKKMTEKAGEKKPKRAPGAGRKPKGGRRVNQRLMPATEAAMERLAAFWRVDRTTAIEFALQYLASLAENAPRWLVDVPAVVLVLRAEKGADYLAGDGAELMSGSSGFRQINSSSM